MAPELRDQLERIYNTLCQVTVKGNDVVLLGSCLTALIEILTDQKLKEE